MATLTKDGRQITVPDTEIDYYLAQGWHSTSAAPTPPREYPEGEPGQSWKAGELRAYAAAHGIDLGEATKKGDMLAVLGAPPEASTIVEGFAEAARDQVAAAAAASAELEARATSED